LIVKFWAVAFTSGANCGQFAAALSKIRTVVTIFVFTPQHMRLDPGVLAPRHAVLSSKSAVENSYG